MRWMKTRKWSCLALCLAIILSLLLPAASAPAADRKVVKVGLFEDTYHKFNYKGELGGYGFEYFQKIAGYTGWTIEYVKADWYNCFDKLKSGEIDILNGISYTPEREQDMLFSTLPMADERYFIYVDMRKPKISLSDIDSINGKTVGVMVGAVPEQVLSSWENDNGLHTKHLDITTAEDVLQNLDAGNMDCFVSVEEAWQQDYVVPAMYIGSSPVYFALNKDRSDLKMELDNAMTRIFNDDPFYNDALYEKYFAAPTAAIVSDRERQWLRFHGPIRMGYLMYDINVSEENRFSGKLSGVIQDYVKYARDCLGKGLLEFELKGYATFLEEMEALRRGEIDVVFKLPQNTHYVGENNISLSDTMMNVPYAAISMPGHFDQNGANRVAIAGSSLLQKWYIDAVYPQWQIVEYPSEEAAVHAVERGVADCFLVRTGRARRYIKDWLYQVNMLDYEMMVSLGVRREDRELLSILNKTIKAMPKDMLTNGLAVYDNEKDDITAMEFIRDNIGRVAAGILVVGAVFGIIIWSWKKSQRAELEAEKANAAKTDFLRRMSHDIRTPINGIRGMVQIANHNIEDREKQKECNEKIWRATDHLLSLVNDVLDMNKLESGKVELKQGTFSIWQLLDDINAMVEGQAREHGVELVRKSSGRIEHDSLVGSPVYLKRIIMNFITNAIKYNREGGRVEVDLQELSCDGKTAWLEFACEDNGIGMSEEFLAKAFEPFSQEEQSDARTQYNGTGLGLAIAKNLIELMGGNIELHSKLGEGTRIVYRLPFQVAQEKPAAEKAVVDYSVIRLDGIRALLVEDNELNAEIAAFMLEQHGVAVKWVENGSLAVEELRSNPDGYDVVFMDIMMPVMNGLEAAAAIRQELHSKIPIFAMTANAFADDVDRSMAAGMDEHLTKPLREEEILRAVLQHVDPGTKDKN